MSSAAGTPFMTFLWPTMLWAMLGVPIVIALYIFLITRRKKTTLRYASLGLVREAMGRGGAWRRHVPPVLLLLAISALLFASSRPAALITLPSAQETIVLAMDVSGSMRAADVQPTRLVAAQEAAKSFVADLPRNVKIAVVSVAGTAADLKKVYQGLSTRLIVEKKETEISALLAGLGALLVVLAAGLSVWWFGRIA